MLDLFIVTQMIPLLHAPIALYNEDGSLMRVMESVDENVLITEEEISGAAKEFPLLHMEANGVAYALLWSEEESFYLGLGKLRIYDFGDEEAKIYPYCMREEFTAVIVILWKMITGQELKVQEVLERNFLPGLAIKEQLTMDIFRLQEEGTRHSPYSQEVREQECICNGDVGGLRECFEEVYSGKAGTLASDMVRQQKNLAICTITTSARSAIKGGMHPELAFSMSDTFIYQIEEQLTEPIKIQNATREAQIEYARQVSRLHQGSEDNSFMNQVRDYVFCHIHEPILVREVAEHMGVSPNYLSERFRRGAGMTLKQYIIDQKVLTSEKLLKYTDYSLQEISNICAFSSQSRFGEYFQRKNGMSPTKYRKKYRI